MAHIKKTLLSVAIATASASAFAIQAPSTVDVSGTGALKLGDTYDGGVTLTGQRPGNVQFNGLDTYSDVTSTAVITATGEGKEALSVESDSGQLTLGSFTNAGNVSAIGTDSIGMVITDARITHGNSDLTAHLTNQGRISAEGTNAMGILLENMVVGGDLLNDNSGVITVSGENSRGLRVNGLHENAPAGQYFATVMGEVLNEGTILVSGKNARGIDLRYADIKTRDIDNSGNIRVNGENATGVLVDHTDYRILKNSGSIVATGEGATGIEIYHSFSAQGAVLPDQDSASGQKKEYLHQTGIINEGIIEATGAAIKITNPGDEIALGELSHMDNMYRITQNSGVIRGGEAIDGNGQAYLFLNGGRIEGNVSGVRGAVVNGEVAIDAAKLKVGNLRLATGKLTLESGHTAVRGNVIVETGSNMAIFVSDSSSNSTPLVDVEGTVTLENGSTISVTTTAGSFTKEGTLFTLLKADSITDQGATFASDTPLLRLSDVVVSDTAILGTVSAAETTEALDGLRKLGVKNNGLEAAKQYIGYVLASLGHEHPLYQAYLTARGNGLRLFSEQLAPDMSGGNVSAGRSAVGLTRGAIAQRVGRGANAGDVLEETGAWVKALNGTADQSLRDGVAGYSADSNGIVIGADGKINENTTLGLAFSHVRTDVASDLGAETEVANNTLSLYAGWQRDQVNVNGSLSYGVGSNESKRAIATELAKADYDSSLLGAEVSAGRAYRFGGAYTIEPVVAARYNKFETDSFKETGSAAALSTGSQSIEQLELGAGFNLSRSYGSFQPSLRLMAFNDLIQDDMQTTSAFLLGGNTFVTDGAKAQPWTYEAGVNVGWSKGNTTLGAGWDYARKAGFSADTWNVSVRWDF